MPSLDCRGLARPTMRRRDARRVKLVCAEGEVGVLGFKLHYKTFGQSRKGTILCLHGGPGLTHEYMLPLADLAKYGYKVVFYDQLGCGKSETTKDVGLFTVERAVEEVEEVRKEL